LARPLNQIVAGHWPEELRATALATVRCETPPDKQLQDDIGETYARIAGERAKVHRHERKVNWLLAMLVKEHEHTRWCWLSTAGSSVAERRWKRTWSAGAGRWSMVESPVRALNSRWYASSGKRPLPCNKCATSRGSWRNGS